MYLTLTLNNSHHYWWYSVIPVATAVPLKVPAQGPQGMVSMSRNENENNSCQGSPSHQWEGWINQHTEPNSATAKDESSNSWSCWRCHPAPDPALNWWLITLTVLHSLPRLFLSVSSSHHCSHCMWVHHHQDVTHYNFWPALQVLSNGLHTHTPHECSQ